MKRLIRIALSLSCVLGLGMGQTAFAAQFNVTVPVNLSRMPANVTHVIVKGFLLCAVDQATGVAGTLRGDIFNGANSWNVQAGDTLIRRQVVGVSQQIRSIDTGTGEFHSSIVLNMNVAPGFFPNNVGSYFYLFRLKQDGQEIDPAEMPGLSPLQIVNFVGNLSYQGNFSNPAVQGSRCDSPDFTD